MRISLSEGIGDRVLKDLNTAYAKRCQALCDILQTEPGIQIDTIPLGGYFVWVTFSGIDDTAVFDEYCQSKGVKFLAGRRCDSLSSEDDKEGENIWTCGLPANTCQKRARLCFADMDFDDLEQGARLLVSCYRDCKSGGRTRDSG